MSNIDLYKRIPVKLDDVEESNRRHADGINYLLENVASIDDRLTTAEAILEYMILVGREFAALDGQTGTFLSGTIITDWDTGATAHPESLITVDPVAGSFTIGAAGMYQVAISLIWTGTANNQDYDLIGHINGGVGERIGYAYQPSQAADATTNLVTLINLAAGDVVTLSMVGAATIFELGQMSLELKIPEIP